MKKETKEATKRFEEKLKGGFFTPRKNDKGLTKKEIHTCLQSIR